MATAKDMNLTDELRKLANLHREGALTDQEFAEGKKRLLAQTADEPAARHDAETRVEAAAEFEEKTYFSSRWSSGNLFFRDRLTMAHDGMHFRKGAMFGSTEENINYHSVASFRVTNGVFLANICVETSGGTQPIFINGLWKSDARKVQDTLRACQGSG